MTATRMSHDLQVRRCRGIAAELVWLSMITKKNLPLGTIFFRDHEIQLGFESPSAGAG
jgi:hypothetical protein